MDFLKIIQEGRVDDFKSKYTQKFGSDGVNKIIEVVPQKFLDWVGKNLDVVNFDENLNKLVTGLKKFEKTSTNFPITDLYQYKSIEQFLKAVSDYETKQRRDIKRVEGGNVVFDDGRYFIVNPLTQQSSCYYGKGTKWCTAAEGNSHFHKYNQDGKLFYILDRTLPTNDPHYKVAILKKFDGDKSYWDAKDDPIRYGWILNTDKLEQMLSSIDDYMKEEFGEQLSAYAEKEAIKKEKERQERLRIQRRDQQRREEAEERRLDNEWELGPDCPEEGLKAHALLNWLVDTSDVEVMTNADRGEIARIENEIQRLQNEYDNDEEGRPDLLDEISDLEDELDELTKKIDVYNIIPTGSYYYTTEFEVIDSPDLEGRTYAVGNDSEMQRSCEESIENLIDDVGYEGFNQSFVRNHLDERAIISYAEDLFDQDIRDNPESYIDEEERMLSDRQEETIARLERNMLQIESMISRLEDEMDGENEEQDEETQEKIDELNEKLEEIKDEITEIQDNPEGDYSEIAIEDAIRVRVKDVEYDPEEFLKEFGLDLDEYVDKDSLIESIIDEDGYGHTLNSYDGNADDVRVQDELYYVMRIN